LWGEQHKLLPLPPCVVLLSASPAAVLSTSPHSSLHIHPHPANLLLPACPRACLAAYLAGAGKNLQAQYERWQPRAKYKMHLDPTTEDVKKLAISCRRTAKV
jgi:regulator-associated protein of mTOR